MSQKHFDAVCALVNGQMAVIKLEPAFDTPIHLAAVRLALIRATFKFLGGL